MIAIQYSDTNTVKLLIDNGADVVTENGTLLCIMQRCMVA